MNEVVRIEIPVDEETAKALANPARREAAGRFLTDLVHGGRIREVLAEVIAEIKREARANGLTDEVVDDELAIWRAEESA